MLRTISKLTIRPWIARYGATAVDTFGSLGAGELSALAKEFEANRLRSDLAAMEQLQAESKKRQNGVNRKKKGRLSELVREKVRKVLEDETQLADKRARLCDEGDFLKLLYSFNQEGIHFS